MTGWDSITADEIRDELAGFTGDDGMGVDDGWLTLAELSAKLRLNRHPLAQWLKRRMAEGEVERGERRALGVDGRRITQAVYRLVEQER